MTARAHRSRAAPRPDRDLNGLVGRTKPGFFINKTGKVLIVVQQGDQPHDSRTQRSFAAEQATRTTGCRRSLANLLSGPRSVATQLGVGGTRHPLRPAHGAMLPAVPAPPAELASVAQDFAPTPRQP